MLSEWAVVFLLGHTLPQFTPNVFSRNAHYIQSQVKCFTRPPLNSQPLRTPLHWIQLRFLSELQHKPWIPVLCVSSWNISRWKPGRRMKFKTHLQMENQTSDHNSNSRSQAGSLNRWIYTAGVEESMLQAHSELRFGTTEIETFRGKSLKIALIPAPGLGSARKVLSR